MKIRALSFTALIAVLALALPVQVAQAQANGVAFIDSQEILEQWPAARDAMETFQREVRDAQARVRGMEEELSRMQEDLEQQQSALSQEAMQQRVQAFQQQMMQYQQDVGRIEGDLEGAQQRRVEQLREQITTVVEAVRRERNLAVVMDRSAAGVVAADSSLDLTDEVLRRLR